MIKKVLIDKDGHKLCVKDDSKDFHTKDGVITKDDLKKNGKTITTNTGSTFTVFDPVFIDKFNKIKRGAQIMILKEIGPVIAYTGIDKDSVCLDAGAGSGSLSCFLAHLVKKVTTYDINENHIKTVKENIENLGLKNIIVKKQDICEKITEKELDLITLDIPNPQDALNNCEKALKIGGFLVSYSPNLTQVQALMIKLKDYNNLLLEKNIEILEREWTIDEKRSRPNFGDIGHTGFLTFIRKIRD